MESPIGDTAGRLGGLPGGQLDVGGGEDLRALGELAEVDVGIRDPRDVPLPDPHPGDPVGRPAGEQVVEPAFERSLGREHTPATTGEFVAAITDVRPSITAVTAREFDEDIDRFARF